MIIDYQVHAPAQCYPSYDWLIEMERLQYSLSFAITVGNHERASELADHILDVMRP